MDGALRVWQINENSTRYDVLTAVETDNVLLQMWTGWAALAYVGAFFAGSLFVAILSSKRTRTNPFNFYILTLTFPDFFFNLFCAMTCTVNATVVRYQSKVMCNFQGFYCVFGIGTNLWVGALIAYEIHKMLNFSRVRRRYSPPQLRTIIRQVAAVYTICTAFGLLGLVDQPWIPFHYRASGGGAACVPLEIDLASTIFFWAFFIPFYAGVPFLYVVGVATSIAIQNLLPPKGRRRLLTLYFFKILMCFSLAWLPFVVLVHVIGPYLPVWVLWFAGAVSHLQSVISVVLAMMKPDIRHAVFRLWTLKTCFGPEDEGVEDDDDPFDVMGFLRWSATSLRSSFRLSTRQLDPHQINTTEATAECSANEGPVTGSPRLVSVMFADVFEDDDTPDEDFGFSEPLEEVSLPTEPSLHEQDAEGSPDVDGEVVTAIDHAGNGDTQNG